MAECHRPHAASVRSPASNQARLETKTRNKFLTGRNFLNTFFVLEGALLVMISQAPARFDTEERAAVGPEGEIRDAREIERDHAARGRIGKGKGAIRYIDEFENVRAGKLFAFEWHFAAGGLNVFGF